MNATAINARHLSSRFVAWLMNILVALSAAGCFTVDVGEHKVSPEVESGLKTPFEKIDVTAADTENEAKQLVQALSDSDIDFEYVDNVACLGKEGGAEREYFWLDSVFSAETKKTAANCNIDYVVVVGELVRSNQTELAASIINYKKADEAETVHIQAEGKVGGLTPAPLPYLSLLYFRSTPDTEGSAIDALAEAIIERVGAKNRKTQRLLYLKSSNLPSIAKQQMYRAEKYDGTDDDGEMSRYNPFRFYVHMNKEASEEGNPLIHNPIGQAMTLMISIMAAPMALVLDTAFGRPDQGANDDVNTVTPEEEKAIADATDAINRQDWEAAYRSLEGCLISRNRKIRDLCNYQIKKHPELLEAARQTFSESALRHSKMIHGDSALKIERQRMTIYERNAMLEDVAKASIHMHKVFPGYQDIINRKLRVEAGAYCPNADLGHADAQRKIADIYYFRLYGVKKDLQQAYIWYSLSAKGGDYESDVQLEEVISEMSSEELAEAKELLEHWKPGQCKKGLFRNSLGFLQENDGNQ
jgi:hypothetical protein